MQSTAVNNKTILILLDGLNYATASTCMGFLLAYVEAKHAQIYRLKCALPAVSRPLYETILTGQPPIISGITHNAINRLSHQESIFHLARQANKSTAAAAYHWVSELYNVSPYEAHRDRFTDNLDLPIQHGIFYHADHYPDDHLFLDAHYLIERWQPDFMFIHSMNVDDAGHKFGGESSQYRNAARSVDSVLALHLPHWLAQGYQIMVTSDHGMNADKSHLGILPEEREVPLFLIGERFNQQVFDVSQLALCGIAADILGLSHNKLSHPGLLKS